MTFFKVDTRELDRLVQRTLPEFTKQLPFAIARALTDTAKAVQPVIVADLESKFDRVSPWVKRGILVRFATKKDLTAVVYANPNATGSSVPTARILQPHMAGGTRGKKRFEVKAGKFAAPARGARLDTYGNIARRDLKAVLPALDGKAQTDGGAKRAFFQRGNTVFERMPDGRIKPVLMVTNQPSYSKRLDWPAIARPAIERAFVPAFRQRMGEAIKTAKR